MVHQLRPMFSRILPMMGMVKQENYRWVYTAVLYKFCLALIDFQANGDEAERATFAPQQFENDAFAAYEVFLTSAWIGSKESKVGRRALPIRRPTFLSRFEISAFKRSAD